MDSPIHSEKRVNNLCVIVCEARVLVHSFLDHRGSTLRESTISGVVTPSPSTSSNRHDRVHRNATVPCLTSLADSSSTAKHPRYPQVQEQRSPAHPARPTSSPSRRLSRRPPQGRAGAHGLRFTQDRPIYGLGPSVVVHPRHLHPTLGIIVLTPPPARRSPRGLRDGTRAGVGARRPAAARLFTLFAPHMRAFLAHPPVQVPLGRLAIMQPDAHCSMQSLIFPRRTAATSARFVVRTFVLSPSTFHMFPNSWCASAVFGADSN